MLVRISLRPPPCAADAAAARLLAYPKSQGYCFCTDMCTDFKEGFIAAYTGVVDKCNDWTGAGDGAPEALTARLMQLGRGGEAARGSAFPGVLLPLFIRCESGELCTWETEDRGWLDRCS